MLVANTTGRRSRPSRPLPSYRPRAACARKHGRRRACRGRETRGPLTVDSDDDGQRDLEILLDLAPFPTVGFLSMLQITDTDTCLHAFVWEGYMYSYSGIHVYEYSYVVWKPRVFGTGGREDAT